MIAVQRRSLMSGQNDDADRVAGDKPIMRNLRWSPRKPWIVFLPVRSGVLFSSHGSQPAIRMIAQGTKEELVAQSFGGRSDVLMRFASGVQHGAEWAAPRGGKVEDGVAHFSVEQPTDIAALLDAAAHDGLEVIDVTLRRPNLESVFLQLTGRGLRQ